MTKVFDVGGVLPIEMRKVSSARGRIPAGQQHDATRGWHVVVTPFPIAGPGSKTLLPLYDAALVSANDDTWSTGHERIISVVMRNEVHVAQT